MTLIQAALIENRRLSVLEVKDALRRQGIKPHLLARKVIVAQAEVCSLSTLR